MIIIEDNYTIGAWKVTQLNKSDLLVGNEADYHLAFDGSYEDVRPITVKFETQNRRNAMLEPMAHILETQTCVERHIFEQALGEIADNAKPTPASVLSKLDEHMSRMNRDVPYHELNRVSL